METFYSYAAAHGRADESQMVCGVLVNDRPTYFVMPKDASDVSVAEAAFAVRHGRDMHEGERRLASMAKARRPDIFEVET